MEQFIINNNGVKCKNISQTKQQIEDFCSLLILQDIIFINITTCHRHY